MYVHMYIVDTERLDIDASRYTDISRDLQMEIQTVIDVLV